MREKPSYNEENTQTAPFPTSRAIGISGYRHPRASTKDENRQLIHLGNDEKVLEAHLSHPDDRNDSHRSRNYFNQRLDSELRNTVQGLDRQRPSIHVQVF